MQVHAGVESGGGGWRKGTHEGLRGKGQREAAGCHLPHCKWKAFMSIQKMQLTGPACWLSEFAVSPAGPAADLGVRAFGLVLAEAGRYPGGVTLCPGVLPMSPTVQSLGIDQLSVADRLRLVQEIWDSIAAEAQAA